MSIEEKMRVIFSRSASVSHRERNCLWGREIVLGLGLRSSSLWKGHLRRLKVMDKTDPFQDIPWRWRIPYPHSPNFCTIIFKVINGGHHPCFHPACLQKLCGLQLLNHEHQLKKLSVCDKISQCFKMSSTHHSTSFICPMFGVGLPPLGIFPSLECK